MLSTPLCCRTLSSFLVEPSSLYSFAAGCLVSDLTPLKHSRRVSEEGMEVGGWIEVSFSKENPSESFLVAKAQLQLFNLCDNGFSSRIAD